MGVPNALLYQLAKDPSPYQPYRDITSGCNGNYCAGSGYDLVTGLGSPDAWSIARDLVAQIQTNVESDVFWGSNTGNGIDLMHAYFQGATPGWHLTDVTQTIQSFDPSTVLHPLPNTGKPGIVRYQTQGAGTEIDAFMLATTNGTTPVLYGVTYLPQSGAWSELGEVTKSGALNYKGLPFYNPTVVALGTPPNGAVALFGITSAGHLIEYYLNYQHSQDLQPDSFFSADISSYTGVTCDDKISPSAVVYQGSIQVFADCGGKLTQFYAASGWHANSSISNGSIPNASESFPGHSIAAISIPASPPDIEVYVASDRNGASTLNEFLYNGSQWIGSTLISSGHIPDQVSATSVLLFNADPISEAITSDPAPTTCTQSDAEQYLYQSQLTNPAFHVTLIPDKGVTDSAAILLSNGSSAFTEAFTGVYSGTTTVGGAGGGGCSTGLSVDEDYSTLSSSNTQTWAKGIIEQPPLGTTYPGDNSGIDPAGVELPY